MKKRTRKTRGALEQPYCVILSNSVNRTWFETEAEAIEHAKTLDAKRTNWINSQQSRGHEVSGAEFPREFSVVRVTATVGPKPPEEPPFIVRYFK